MEEAVKLIAKGIFIMVTAGLLAVLLSIPVWWLWNNCLVGAIDGIHQIGILQALGLNFLTSMLFGSTNKNIANKLQDSVSK